ncbi:hypothetical protein J6E39_04075 [bacterium]|nr:hypothetical protein [bacterium]
MSTGTIMMAIPWTAAAGKILFDIGLYGTLACGVAKATINIANGNLTAGLMALGQTVITAATSAVGAGEAANGVMSAVSAGLNVVSNTAELVNNVRAVQGKEANGVFGAISTIAGVGSSLTNSANSLSQMGGASTLGKFATVASSAGSLISGVGQITTLIDEDSEFGNMMNQIGTAVGTVGAVASLANMAKAKSDQKNNDNKEQADENKTKADNAEKKADDTTNENKTNQDKSAKDQKTDADKTKNEVEQKSSDKDNKNKTDKTNEKENNKSKDKIEKAKTKEEKKAEKAAQKNRENNIKKEGASEEFADMDNDKLGQELGQAMKNGDTEKINKLSQEKQRRVSFKANSMQQANNNKMDKFGEYAQLAGNLLNAAGGFLANDEDAKTEDEKHIKKFFQMSDYAKEIARKRKMRVNSIEAMYRAR